MFKDRLKEARKRNRLTQSQLAEIIGVAKSTVTGYEKGNSEPDMTKIQQIMRALKVDANYLWQDEMTYIGGRSLGFADDTGIFIAPWHTPLTAAYEKADVSTRAAACRVLEIDYVEPHSIPCDPRVSVEDIEDTIAKAKAPSEDEAANASGA